MLSIKSGTTEIEGKSLNGRPRNCVTGMAPWDCGQGSGRNGHGGEGGVVVFVLDSSFLLSKKKGPIRRRIMDVDREPTLLSKAIKAKTNHL